MAFTQEERVKIRLYLGFPDVFRDGNTRLENAMDVIGERPETKTRVQAILTEIDAILPQLSGSSSSGGVSTVISGSLKRVDEIEFYPTGSSESGSGSVQTEVKKLGRMWCNQLSIVMGVPLANDIFSGRGYSGDWWSGDDFQIGNGWRIPLG